jgi:hypothetical protein
MNVQTEILNNGYIKKLFFYNNSFFLYVNGNPFQFFGNKNLINEVDFFNDFNYNIIVNYM